MSISAAQRSQLIELYVAIAGRAPDGNGLAYWSELVAAGVPIKEIAGHMFNTPDAQALYPRDPLGDAAAQAKFQQMAVDQFYSNVLGREPDEAGRVYWLDVMAKQGVQSVLSEMINAVNLYDGTDPAGLQSQSLFRQKVALGDAFAKSPFANDLLKAATVLKDLQPDGSSTSLKLAQAMSVKIPGMTTGLAADDIGIRALDSGEKWSGLSLGWGFNTSIPAEYYEHPELIKQWSGAIASERVQFRKAVGELAEVVAMPFVEVPASQADIRFNVVETSFGGFAYYPTTPVSALAGDVFMARHARDISGAYDEGQYYFMAVIHELGHAMGLKHPFEDTPLMPTALDNHINTVMSYTDFRFQTWVKGIDGLSNAQIYPHEYSIYDIAALQKIYGVNKYTRAGDDVYTLDCSKPFYTTIWDAAGTDLIDASSADYACKINLTPGSHSDVNYRSIEQQIADTQAWYREHGKTNWDSYVRETYQSFASDTYTGEQSLAIAFGVVVENVITGKGNDEIRDNAADNRIVMGAGDDVAIMGAGGFDTVFGGDGFDTVKLSDTMSSWKVSAMADGYYLLLGARSAIQVIGIEKISFIDQSIMI